MPTQSPSFVEIQKTNKNTKSDIKDAVVIANYGDPGIDEDYHADILSRYVICMLESANRVLTFQKWAKMIVFVKRPEELWIKYKDGFNAQNLSTLRRADATLNMNVGRAGAYSVDTIPRINYPYTLGERIKIKQIDRQDILYSDCNEPSQPYGPWHSQGAANLDYLEGLSDGLRNSTLFKVDENRFNLTFNKSQFEAMVLSLYNNDKIKSLFSGGNSTDGNGGYYFKDLLNTRPVDYIVYEDINVGGKARIPSNTCLPLVVTSPNSFTVPKTRAIGTVNYNPVYVPIKQN